MSLNACGSGEDQSVEALGVEEVVGYWSVLGKRGDNFYILPVVRFQIRNDGAGDVDYIQTMAVFRLESSPDAPWGNAYEYRPLDTKTYEILSLGEDGQADTDDDLVYPKRDR